MIGMGSAKNYINVEPTFLCIARAMKNRLMQNGGCGPMSTGVKYDDDAMMGPRIAYQSACLKEWGCAHMCCKIGQPKQKNNNQPVLQL